MRELSLHILDIVQNSIVANADHISIEINESRNLDRLTITIKDNGKGMTAEFLKEVTDPFVTTRTTRKVGLGLSLYRAAAMQCDGDFEIQSILNQGTTVTASFRNSHIDRLPIGNMAETMTVLIGSNPDIDFDYKYRVDQLEFKLSTKEMREMLGEVPLNDPEVIEWIKQAINEGMIEIGG